MPLTLLVDVHDIVAGICPAPFDIAEGGGHTVTRHPWHAACTHTHICSMQDATAVGAPCLQLLLQHS